MAYFLSGAPITYPVYIGHNLVIAFVHHGLGIAEQSALIVSLAIVFGLMLNVVVERPIDRFRNRLTQRLAPAFEPSARPAVIE